MLVVIIDTVFFLVLDPCVNNSEVILHTYSPVLYNYVIVSVL